MQEICNQLGERSSSMHHMSLEQWQHTHVFNKDKSITEKRTLIVVIITFITMIAEIVFGWLTNSMALFADGWHMGTHAFALGISLFAYIFARKHAYDTSFTFGTWKIEILGAYSSSIVLAIVGGAMIFTSIERLVNPLQIQYDQAIYVAVIGLVINVLCALILSSGHSHAHTHEHGSHHHHHDDLNLKSAYFHVIADAMTSILAIGALFGAKYLKITWLDPAIGILGAILILRWAYLLIKESAKILLDKSIQQELIDEIYEAIESDGDTKISDIHLIKVADTDYAGIISLVSHTNYTLEEYKKRLIPVHELVHITIEINPCGANH